MTAIRSPEVAIADICEIVVCIVPPFRRMEPLSSESVLSVLVGIDLSFPLLKKFYVYFLFVFASLPRRANAVAHR